MPWPARSLELVDGTDPFIEELRRPRPDPGGGSAAAHVALIASAIAEKLAQIEARRLAGASPERLHWEDILERARRLSEDFQRLRKEDVSAYAALAEAVRRGAGRDKAAQEACLVPLAIMKGAIEGLRLTAAVGGRCRIFLKPDALTAAEFFGAAAGSACHIGLSNVLLLEEEKTREDLVCLFSELLRDARDALRSIRKDLGQGVAAGCR